MLRMSRHADEALFHQERDHYLRNWDELMKYAIISDIQANLEALTKALEIIDEEKPDEIVCLGDIVGYGANPNECVELVRSRCASVILGNHDAAAIDTSQASDFNPNARAAIKWTAGRLTDASRAFLASLPMTARTDGILFVHSSPEVPAAWNYVIDAADAAGAMQYFDERLCFIGHTHVPGIFSIRGRAKTVTRDEKFIVNVGSVGQPRDGNPMLAFGMFDTAAWEYRQIRSWYDAEQAAVKIYEAGLPGQLGYRLMYGI
jgi:diadenosine tetraphosphatase ApaH/serine/threonine PP2A family protein phosphatase